MLKRLLLAAAFSAYAFAAQAACQTGALPFNLQQGTVANATDVMANFNQIVNGVAANCAGSGANTDITSLNGLTSPLSYTIGGSFGYIGTTSGGSANAQTVTGTTPVGFSLVLGKWIVFTVGPTLTNTGAATLQVGATAVTAINRLGKAGVEPLVGGELVAGNTAMVLYNGTSYVLMNYPAGAFGVELPLASATPNLGTIASHNAFITGTTAITSFGSLNATVNDPIYLIRFEGILTLTNSASLGLPGGGNIITAPNDTAIAEYLGGTNWLVRGYQKANGTATVTPTPICGAQGLVVTNNSGTPNTNIDYSADQVSLVTTGGSSIYFTSVTGTINTTTGTVTSTPDGMDGTARPTSAFGHVFLISNGTLVKGLVSSQSVSPTMPTGYTYKCRVGAMNFDGSQTLYRTMQRGNETAYVVSATNTTQAALTLTSMANSTISACTLGAFASQFTALSLLIPQTAVKVYVSAQIVTGNSGSASMSVGANNTSTTPPLSFSALNSTTSAVTMTNTHNFVLETPQSLWVCGTSSSGSTGRVWATAWTDKVNVN